MKRCTGCDVTKPTSEFYDSSDGGLMSRCKECWKAQVRKHRRESERPREYDRERAKESERKAHSRLKAIP
jgi:predicted  nucleic acid-binding Zn-ribbon protein